MTETHNIPADALRVINSMFSALSAAGWKPVAVFDGEETERVKTRSEAITVINSVEESVVKFRKDGVTHTVLLIPGNGGDVISDHSYSDSDDFADVMELV